MADLVDKLFREDLDESEFQALSELLEKSEEAAFRYGAKAEHAYFAYGLPEPLSVLPGRGAAHWMRLIVLGVVLSAILAGWYKRTREEGKLPCRTAPKAVADRTGGKALGSPGDRSSIRTAAPAAEGPSRTKGASRTEFGKEAASPPRLLSSGSRSFSGVEVVVKQPSPGAVTVRVLSEGTEVRRLYEGALDAGEWSFVWDGMLSEGASARPGRYSIEVVGPRGAESWEVSIR